jgi:hypothetical protein
MVDYPDAPTPGPAQAPGSGPAPSQSPAPAPVRPQASGGSSRGTTLLFALAGLIAVGGVAFAVGRLTAPTAAAATGRFGTGAAGFRGQFGANASFAPGEARGFLGGGLAGAGGAADVTLRGTVQSINGNTMTLRTASGGTVTVDLSGSTTYHKQAAASSTDVTPGSQVLVQVQFDRAGPGAAPLASGAPAGGGAPLASGAPRTFTASDVTVVTP